MKLLIFFLIICYVMELKKKLKKLIKYKYDLVQKFFLSVKITYAKTFLISLTRDAVSG